MTLGDWGWDDQWAHHAALLGGDVLSVARLVGQDRASWAIQTQTGPETARIPSASNVPSAPVVGDWVIAEPGPMPTDPWSILAVFPRRSWISRGAAGAGGAEHVLAANVDKVWIVHGLDRPFNASRMERYLAVVWEGCASPEIILTKTDLVEDLATWVSQIQTVAIGVPITSVSSEDPKSVQELQGTLSPGSTVTLLGPSGVGKSTLVNLLAGEAVAATGEVRDGDRKGRHTTTRRELFRMPGGALLLDTPGLRLLRVWSLEEGLARVFPDIEELAQSCRFRDCRHDGEPQCAVLEAINEGDLAPRRLDSFRKLQAEAAHENRKVDPLARAAALSEWKTSLKTVKYHPKYKDRNKG